MSTQSRRCGDFDAVVSAYVNHEATAEEMALLEAHARNCVACTIRLRRYRTLAPRLEADVRTMLSQAEIAARKARPTRSRNRLDRVAPGATRVPVIGRSATLAALLAMSLVVVVVILVRSAPAIQAPLGSRTQPSPTTTGATGSVSSPAPVERAPVLVASIDGLVDPAVAAYVHRAVAAAEERHAGGLLVVLDASGGLDGPMRQVAQELSASSVPTMAYLAPGTTNAADVTLAQASAVRADATISRNQDDFLRSLDGREARTPAGPVVLATAGAPIQTLDMEPLEAIAHRLMDPTIAYLLFVIGLYAAFVELAHPGAMLPGLASLVCLTLASLAFAVLPTNWLGVGVLVVAVGLMGVELKAATHGALVGAGVVCLIVGSFLLYAAPGSFSPIRAEVTVAPPVFFGAAGMGLVIGLLLARIALRIHNLPPVIGLEQLIGARGVASGELVPQGVVQVRGQLWSARVRGGHLEAGQPVRVVARHGLVLEVESTASGGAATRKGIS